MPIYEYQCPDCENIFEEWQKSVEAEVAPCPDCQTESPRIISNTSFVLKGSGWYVTDYCQGKSSSGNGNGNDTGNGNGNGSDKKESSSTADSSASSSSDSSSSSASSSTEA
ncbi:FmdB family zinc ribbon protein [Desulfohalovibrio reitneri]|uniref:FmdB family zinc ribbon protein n=1 Tax=Desulfohalovibrio reitneri TaxID=1307759 RepID=UPI0004A723EB|nr:zinc ribbon domain-containing protein [Desulfohalovibrio reitneri]